MMSLPGLSGEQASVTHKAQASHLPGTGARALGLGPARTREGPPSGVGDIFDEVD